jgi:hypothetical protein
MAEFPSEIQKTFDYSGETKTVSGFLEDVLVSLVAQETAVERPRSFGQAARPGAAPASTSSEGRRLVTLSQAPLRHLALLVSVLICRS